ncbi:phosphorylase family protein [Chryseobacterium sp. A301]
MAICIDGTTYHRPLLVFAMEAEAGQEFKEFETLFTGVGKVNAAYHLTKRLMSGPKPDLVLNLGTAGSSFFNRGEIVVSEAFVQRDMDVSGLGLPKYKTPFIEEPEVLGYGLVPKEFEKGICGSGDNFETTMKKDIFNLIDMEAYAFAFLCKREDLPFLCLKYVSDGADESAAQDWSSQLKVAANALREAVKKLEV